MSCLVFLEFSHKHSEFSSRNSIFELYCDASPCYNPSLLKKESGKSTPFIFNPHLVLVTSQEMESWLCHCQHSSSLKCCWCRTQKIFLIRNLGSQFWVQCLSQPEKVGKWGGAQPHKIGSYAVFCIVDVWTKLKQTKPFKNHISQMDVLARPWF